MKATLSFNIPEDQDDFERAIKAPNMNRALWDIANNIFRPARKHGYLDEKLNNMLNNNQEVKEAISILEKMFYSILEDENIIL